MISQVAEPIAVDFAPGSGAASSGSCSWCIPLGMGALSAALFAGLAWRWNRPRSEIVVN
ncbi:MAG: hypothetical protein P8J50_00955 [Acidimicrobiales bacterium]|nr:hypothetical protein [Acidimicrobiales bacterium]